MVLRPLVTTTGPAPAKAQKQQVLRQRQLVFVSLLLSLLLIVVSTTTAVSGVADTTNAAADQQQQEPQQPQASCSTAAADLDSCSSRGTNYRHLVVLVHGYLGSHREQSYLAEALIEEGRRKSIPIFQEDDRNTNPSHSDNNSCHGRSSTCGSNHTFIILTSKANTNDTTDGVVRGGERLAVEISDFIKQQQEELQRSGGLHHTDEEEEKKSTNTVLTLSIVGNSLGGLFSRYALGELVDLFHSHTNNQNRNGINDTRTDRARSIPVFPLVFCTTSSPHLGVSQETFVELPRWTEPYVATVFNQQTMADLFAVNNSTVVMDMCRRSISDNLSIVDKSNDIDNDEEDHQTKQRQPKKDYLRPLQQFQKRIAVANAYNTDFLVSVSSGAFLSSESDSVHHHQDSDAVVAASTRLMKDTTGHVALQVATMPTAEEEEEEEATSEHAHNRSSCANSLDRLGWHKVFIDTRSILPTLLNLQTPELEAKANYTSRELKHHFSRYGTLFPIAHPLNMANSKTDWYRYLTKWGQPIVDALAELLVLDMIEMSEREY